MNNDVDVNEQAETITGVDQEIRGVDGTEEEISRVGDVEGAQGMATPGVSTQEVDDDIPNTAHRSDEAKIEPTNVEHTSGEINLHRQPRKEYNHKNYNNVFNITDETQKDGSIYMQLKYEEDSGIFDDTEEEFDKVEATYCLFGVN